MFRELQWRVLILGVALALLVVSICGTAHTAWMQVRMLQERLTTVQLESFRIADHFQQTIPQLNHTLLHHVLERDDAAWNQFVTNSEALDHWIDEQMPRLTSEKERQLLEQLNVVYDGYRLRAHQFHERLPKSTDPVVLLAAFDEFDRTTGYMMSLGYDLAAAHRESLGQFLAESNKSLNRLRELLLVSLLALLLLGGGLGVVIYREMIAPLRLQLVESHELLERQEKLASLGLLAAGVAHEIRNPLTAIKARLFTQQKLLPPGSPERVDAEVIGQEINRLERIVKDFLLFARPAEPQLDTVPADAPLREVAALLGPQAEKQNIQIEVVSAAPVTVQIDAQQIKQVLINLVQNAADSIGSDGRITLRVRQSQMRLRGRHQLVVILEVSDTGKGIPPDVQKRLFDPFFTTKDAGTGLGLPIAARIMERHGGLLEYQTEVGRGTTFGLVLPTLPPVPPA